MGLGIVWALDWSVGDLGGLRGKVIWREMGLLVGGVEMVFMGWGMILSEVRLGVGSGAVLMI